MNVCHRIEVPVVEPVANSNIRRRYAIEDASWIWHPDFRIDDPVDLRFINRFAVEELTEVILHVSADQRYELSLDGVMLSRGPDRSDLAHWSFASYKIELSPGPHELEALVWWLGDKAPCAQVSRRGGFICVVEGLEKILNTGTGRWMVSEVGGVSYGAGLTGHYHVIGPSQTIDGHMHYEESSQQAVDAVVIDKLRESSTGVVHEGWQLHPSSLPDQVWKEVRCGKIRAVTDQPLTQPIQRAACSTPKIARWQALIDGAMPAEIPPNSTLNVLWDLEDYYCGYSSIVLSGGFDSEVSIEWAESLFEPAKDQEIPRVKGNRDDVQGKVFIGFGDRFLNDGGEKRAYRSSWWRSGRYIRLFVETNDHPLKIDDIHINETRYPLENEGTFRSSDADLDAIIPLAVRGIQMCSHETFMDCPYYEQMMYVGDTRMEILTTYTMTRDERLVRRAIELFDWSRWKSGFVAERYPSSPYQQCLPFSMLWVGMLRDYAYWRDDPEWVRRRMVGMRCLLENLRPLLNESSLLEGIPGWPWMDWTDEWERGVPPDGEGGVSAPINLLFIQALRHAADLEEAYGEEVMAARNRELADRVAQSLIESFWVEERGMLSDDLKHEHYSEHSQCLALLTDILPEERQKRCLDGLLSAPDLTRATIYFSFYLLETLRKFHRGDLILKKMDAWKELVGKGLKTPVEKPGITRSDCHAWGSHPLFHFHATFAGIRPMEPSFKSVLIEPLLGGLSHVESSIPHPRGTIHMYLDMEDSGDAYQIRVTLPPETQGVLKWKGQTYPLNSGTETIWKLSGANETPG